MACDNSSGKVSIIVAERYMCSCNLLYVMYAKVHGAKLLWLHVAMDL